MEKEVIPLDFMYVLRVDFLGIAMNVSYLWNGKWIVSDTLIGLHSRFCSVLQIRKYSDSCLSEHSSALSNMFSLWNDLWVFYECEGCNSSIYLKLLTFLFKLKHFIPFVCFTFLFTAISIVYFWLFNHIAHPSKNSCMQQRRYTQQNWYWNTKQLTWLEKRESYMCLEKHEHGVSFCSWKGNLSESRQNPMTDIKTHIM